MTPQSTQTTTLGQPLLLALIMLLSITVMAGCGKKTTVTAESTGLKAVDDEPADNNTVSDEVDGTNDQEDDASGDGSNVPVDVVDDTTLPEGGPVELVKYIESTQRRLATMKEKLDGATLTPEARHLLVQEQGEAASAIQDAAKMVLAAESASPEQREQAAQAGIEILADLRQNGIPGTTDRLIEFVAPLRDDKDPKVRRQANWTMLGTSIEKLLADQVEDGSDVLTYLKILLEDDSQEVSAGLFELSQAAIGVLLRTENVDQGIQAMRMTGEAYANAADPDAQAAGKALLQQLVMVEMQGHMLEAEKGNKEAAQHVLANAQDVLQRKDIDVEVINDVTRFAIELKASEHNEVAEQIFAALGEAAENVLNENADDPQTLVGLQQISSTAELTGNTALAKQINDGLVALLPTITEQRLADHLRARVEPAAKRFGLIGQPFAIAGEKLDGTAFDWATYKGKVVLVDFWATWCGPCVQELPNIKTNYDLYHEHGFEVVGVNIDDQRPRVISFLDQWEAKQGWKIPWQSVYDFGAETSGFKNPIAKNAGVAGIPFVVLVGRDGKVVDIHVRGSRLGDHLAALFPDVELPEEPADDPAATPDEGTTS